VVLSRAFAYRTVGITMGQINSLDGDSRILTQIAISFPYMNLVSPFGVSSCLHFPEINVVFVSPFLVPFCLVSPHTVPHITVATAVATARRRE